MLAAGPTASNPLADDAYHPSLVHHLAVKHARRAKDGCG
jgi:hypothetical protein